MFVFLAAAVMFLLAASPVEVAGRRAADSGNGATVNTGEIRWYRSQKPTAKADKKDGATEPLADMRLPDVISDWRAPQVTARGAIMIDAASGRVLYEKNADRTETPASLTKIVTALIALDSGRLDEVYTVSPAVGNVEYTELETGEQLKARDLLAMALIISDNGAAAGLAELLAGGETEFAFLMNNKAAALGAKHTEFVNPHGLTAAGHFSTARDMALIARQAMQNERFREIVAIREKYIGFLAPAGETLLLENTNDLLWEYPDCIGIKTGWTRAAGGCLAAAAKRDGREIIVVLMSAYDVTSRFRDAAKLLDYGFSKGAGK